MPHGFAGPNPDVPSWPRRKVKPGKADAPGNDAFKVPLPVAAMRKPNRTLPVYSYRRASIGSSAAAFLAG